VTLWNGKRAALSMTFDDGRPSHYLSAIPKLNERSLTGTFFVITGPNEYDCKFQDEHWRDAIKHGHEIGSHSVNHKKAEELDAKEAMEEAILSRKFIEQNLNVTPTSYCYPYTDVNDAVYAATVSQYKQARGGRVARKDKFITPSQSFNMWNLPCYHVGGTTMHVNKIPSIVNEALERNAWVTLMFHTVGEGDSEGKKWDEVTIDQFEGMLDCLLVAQRAGLWVAPFGTVAQNLRENMGKAACG
jgi:peptidoglycan-N-acetylglucosamine deacetylase